MPNWCYNYLSAEGPVDEISKLKQQLNKPFTKVHDQWNPKTGQMELTETTYSNPIFAFHNIYNHIQDGVSEEEYIKQPDHSLPLAEALKFEGNHWYDWNVRHWGTKWDVAVHDDREYSDTEITDESDSSIGYKFNTAWSPPHPIIHTLSEQYPNIKFTLSYEEETGWGGETIIVAGMEESHESYGWKCRECDHAEEETPYCEECDFDTCPSCGYNEADEPCEEHREEHQ
jgi:hypothetical protein